MGRRRWTTGLLIAELALTLVLLAGAGLMMRSFLAVYRADLVVDATHVVLDAVDVTKPEVSDAGATDRRSTRDWRNKSRRFAVSLPPRSPMSCRSWVDPLGNCL